MRLRDHEHPGGIKFLCKLFGHKTEAAAAVVYCRRCHLLQDWDGVWRKVIPICPGGVVRVTFS